MNDLTSLTLAEARDRLKSRAISSLEITKAHLEAIERAKGLNAFVAVTADKALQMAEASDGRLAKKEAGPLEGLPIGVKDLYATKGVHTQACSHILDGFRPPYELTVTANLWRDGAVMLGKLNMDEFAMGSSNETSYYGPVASPWLPPNWSRDRARAALGPNKRGLLTPGGSSGGSVVGCGRATLSRRHGERHRRLHPPACCFHRHCRHQADLRPLLALRHGRLRLVTRSGGTARPHSARRRDHAALDGWARPQGLHLFAGSRSRLRSRGRALGQGHDNRRAERISPRGNEQRNRRPVGARRRMASRRGRERGRRQPPEHAIRAARLLYSGARGGLEQSRALRWRALRPAGTRPPT